MKTRKRACLVCGAPISQCMGFCLARDVLALMEGRKPALGYVRELCGRCVESTDPATIAP